jgi:putative phosphoribosyl transferase
MIFKNRTEAGRLLAKRLAARYAGRKDVIVLGVPRGGVPVAFEVATALKAPLDIFLSRKLGVPGQEELAFGALASGGVRVLDRDIVDAVNLSEAEIEQITKTVQRELDRRQRVYRGTRPALQLLGKAVVLIDDGIATGSSMRAAIRALREAKPQRIVAAVPVAPLQTYSTMASEVDDFVCIYTPESFYAIGEFYEDFSQVTDVEVTELLNRAARQISQLQPPSTPGSAETVDEASLETFPANAAPAWTRH